MESIEQILQNTTGENESKTDWTKAWSAKYPVLADYRNKVDVPSWARRVRALLNELAEEYGFSERDAMLVLKDILYHEYADERRER